METGQGSVCLKVHGHYQNQFVKVSFLKTLRAFTDSYSHVHRATYQLPIATDYFAYDLGKLNSSLSGENSTESSLVCHTDVLLSSGEGLGQWYYQWINY